VPPDSFVMSAPTRIFVKVEHEAEHDIIKNSCEIQDSKIL
jgi:hypothetical protein